MFRRSLTALLCSTMMMAALPAFAQMTPATIAIVNMPLISKESSAAKSARAQIEAKQKAFQTELSKKEESLQKEEMELGKQRSVLSKEAFEEKAKAFRQKATEAQRDVQTKKATLDNAFERAMEEVQRTMNEILAEMSKEKGFNIVAPSTQLLYSDPSLEITNDVLTKLNQKLPKVDVKFDAPAPAKK